jgi:hypothetical protein
MPHSCPARTSADRGCNSLLDQVCEGLRIGLEGRLQKDITGSEQVSGSVSLGIVDWHHSMFSCVVSVVDCVASWKPIDLCSATVITTIDIIVLVL